MSPFPCGLKKRQALLQLPSNIYRTVKEPLINHLRHCFFCRQWVFGTIILIPSGSSGYGAIGFISSAVQHGQTWTDRPKVARDFFLMSSMDSWEMLEKKLIFKATVTPPKRCCQQLFTFNGCTLQAKRKTTAPPMLKLYVQIPGIPSTGTKYTLGKSLYKMSTCKCITRSL